MKPNRSITDQAVSKTQHGRTGVVIVRCFAALLTAAALAPLAIVSPGAAHAQSSGSSIIAGTGHKGGYSIVVQAAPGSVVLTAAPGVRTSGSPAHAYPLIRVTYSAPLRPGQTSPSWSCTAMAFAGKAGPTVLWGQGFQSCSQEMTMMITVVQAAQCAVQILGLCLYFDNAGEMGPPCLNYATSMQWCPASGLYTRGVSKGQEWAAHIYFQAYAPDGSSGSADVYSDPVQF